MVHTRRMGLFDRFRSTSPADVDSSPGEGVFRIADESEARASLTLDPGDLPTDAIVEDAGEEPNGALWEGVTNYVAPTLASRLDMDSEGSMFAVEGERADLEELRVLLVPLVHELPAMTALLRRARAGGVTLEGYGR